MISYIYGIIEGLKWANVITDVEGQCEELQEIVREILHLPEPEPLHNEEPLTEEEFEELMKSEKFRKTFNLEFKLPSKAIKPPCSLFFFSLFRIFYIV